MVDQRHVDALIERLEQETPTLGPIAGLRYLYPKPQGWHQMALEGVAWVETMLAISKVRPKSADYTATVNDFFIPVDASAGNVTISLPPVASNSARQYVIMKVDASSNLVVIDPDGAELIDFASTKILNLQSQSAWIITDSISWMTLSGSSLVNPAGSSFLVFSDPADIPSGAKYMRPGCATVSTNEIFLPPFPRAITAKSLGVSARVPPGTGEIDIFTVRKDAVDTALTVSLTNLNLYAQSTTPVSFAAGTKLSLKLVGGAATATKDVIASVEVY